MESSNLFKFYVKTFFSFCGLKKRILPWFYQHCVSLMLVETSVDLTAQVFPFLGREHLSYSPVRESETPITIWGKTKLTLRIRRVSRCLFSLCLSSFLNNLKILVELWVVAQTQYERALSVMINGISSVNALLCFKIPTIPPRVVPIYIDVNIWQ